jgi:hypothetical protein
LVRPPTARPMHLHMSMPREQHRMSVRRRSDGMAQIQVLPVQFSLGAMRTLRLGVVGVALLLAALVATPFYMALGSRHASQGRGSTPQLIPPK